MATGEDLGRGPEWNDDGLPDVDVEIPDDLRELDREVQAYRREIRRRRRQELLRRFLPGFRRLGPRGVLAPVVAGALIVTAVFGSVLSLLGPRSAETPTGGESSQDASATESDESVGRRLPTATVAVDGTDRGLSNIRSAVVVAVPAHCRCTTSIDTLTSTARTSGVAVYLSGQHAVTSEAARRDGRYPHVLDNATGPLAKRYHPVGLSAVLVDDSGTVTDVVRELQDGRPLREKQLRRLEPTPRA